MILVSDPSGSLWPTPAQEVLLKAALNCDGRALEHYASWRAMIDLEAEFDSGSYRLLPLLYDTLSKLGARDSLMGRLKGTYRRSWCETQTRLQQAVGVLSLLHGEGIVTLMTKGLPLGIAAYGNPALRPMSDLDVVVHHDQAMRAIALLEAHGWSRGPTARDDDVIYHHAMQLFHPVGGEVDLHWHPVMECRSPESEAWFWDHAEPLHVKGVTTRQLDATAMLFHAVVHGIRWNVEPPIRWIADAAMLLNRPSRPVDWSRLLAFAERQQLTFRLGLGLAFLAEHFGLPIPTTVLDDLRRRSPSLIERIENTIALRNVGRMYEHPLLKNWVIFAQYCRIQQFRTLLQFINGFSHFLRVKWKLAGRSQIPGTVLSGLLRRVFRCGWLGSVK